MYRTSLNGITFIRGFDMNSLQREIEDRKYKKQEGYKAANTGGYMVVFFMIIGLIVWGMNLAINF